jgi:hypothetical protein
MLTLTDDQREAVSKRVAKRRVFVYCEANDPTTGDPSPLGLWDDRRTVTYLGKTYIGAGGVFSISSLPTRGDGTIPSLTVTLSGLASSAVALVNARSISQAPITVQIGLWNTQTLQLLEPLIGYFTGKVDDCKWTLPGADGKSTLELTCESASRALTIARTATQTAATCRARKATDGFYDTTGVQRDKPLYFGTKGK